ncbi:dTDP-4-dehydrorhamnose reductase [Adlercreutzia sp. ZJ141]|uniref:dTDP-4-dehydrorhamnose reductase n=1 Tax=Adlercreutzia sp. ZJ141 TaxID=2709406 RepID=UPI0013EBBD55|nr:dTDP-4-dehydrorhamnose reductase [Adlercreutzia sp. ZJ141]
MHILITGAKGQLGNEIVRCLRSMSAEIGSLPVQYENATWDAVNHEALDVTDSFAVEEWFRGHKYDLVINCAADTNVDGCELHEEVSYSVNAIGSENLARAAAEQDAKIVYISTDYVFPGNVFGEREESDEVEPVSAYGRTKLAGERLAMAANPKCFVVRTAWLYGYVGQNFVKTMLRLGSSQKSISVVDDQLGNPTSANDLAYVILKIAASDYYGVFHVTNEGICSWADFATHIMDKAGLLCKVIPVSSAQYKKDNPLSAERPRFSALRNRRLSETVGNEMRPWDKAVDMYLERLKEMEER